MYAIVDIETTGSFAAANGITEIAIHLFDGTSVTETYETLVNPEGYGIAAGAAALCHPDRPMPPPALTAPQPLPGLPDLTAYAARWRVLAEEAMT